MKKGWALTNSMFFKKPNAKTVKGLKSERDYTYCKLKSAGHNSHLIGKNIVYSNYHFGGNTTNYI